MEALAGCSHVYRPDGLNNTLISQGCILENSSHCGNCEQNMHSQDGGQSEEPPIALVQLTGSHVLWMTSPKMNIKPKTIKLLRKIQKKDLCDFEVRKTFFGHRKI